MTTAVPTQQALIEAARSSVALFGAYVRPNYRPAAHHHLIADALARVESSEIRRLMIWAPPRHGKSELVSVLYPSWHLGRHPDDKIVISSYALELARGFSRRSRDLLAQPSYRQVFPDVRLSRALAGADRWGLEGRDGEVYAVGVQGALTGIGADVLVMDDLVKGREEASSRTQRDAVWEWYQTEARTRLQDENSKIIFVSTRWHADDVAGRLLAAQADGGEKWSVLRLPAIDADGRPLWPGRFSIEGLEQTRIDMGSRNFEALYQQNPVAEGGSIFKAAWMTRRWCDRQGCACGGEELPPNMPVLQSIDAAYKGGVSNDYSVIQSWATSGGSHYLIDSWRRRAEYPELKQAVISEAQRHRPRIILVEDAAAGTSIVQDLRRTHLPVVPVKATSSKEVRAEVASPLFESGKVVLPSHAPWLEDYISELLAFPAGVHDDMVDASSQALARLGRVGTVQTVALSFSREAYPVAPAPTPTERPMTRFERNRARRLAAEAEAASKRTGTPMLRVGR